MAAVLRRTRNDGYVNPKRHVGDVLLPRVIVLGGAVVGAWLAAVGASAPSLVVATAVFVSPWIVGIVEARAAFKTVAATRPEKAAQSMPAVLIIPAYLPNEKEILVQTVRAVLADVAYEDPWRLIVAYNSDDRLDVEAELADIATRDSRLLLMHVQDSATKAENLNAALRTTSEPLVGILDADARPESTVLSQAREWLAAGWDFVQGANLVSPTSARITRSVAPEFAAKYLATYAGRFAAFNVAYFSGSNGYWAGATIRSLEFDPAADVEDIDCSIRALRAGGRLAFDPRIRSWETAPGTWRGLWRQRARWAHGWAQLTGRYAWPLARTESLTSTQRAYWVFATLGRRAVVPAAGLALVGAAGHQLLGRDVVPLVLVVLTIASFAWLAGLAQGLAVREHSPGVAPPLYAVSYVLAEAARWWASLLVLLRRPSWIPTPRPVPSPNP